MANNPAKNSTKDKERDYKNIFQSNIRYYNKARHKNINDRTRDNNKVDGRNNFDKDANILKK